MKDVAVIVVTYNRLSLLKECIESIRNQTFKNFDLIIVNNGSTDGTLAWLRTLSNVIVINQENTGGAGGFFTGLKYSAEHNYSYCWFMDDDVICQPDALQILYDTYRIKKCKGFLCSLVLSVDGQPMNVPGIDQRPGKNGYPTFLDSINENLLKVQSATFVSVFLSTRILHELGLPYKEYFIWGDDSEYTNRVSSKYPCYLAFKSIVIHKRANVQSLSIDRETNRQRIKNYFYFYRNNSLNQLRQCDKLTQKMKFHIHYIISLFKYLIKGKFYSFYIILKAYMALFTFNPKIEYPGK